jgi:hypothetical protein
MKAHKPTIKKKELATKINLVDKRKLTNWSFIPTTTTTTTTTNNNNNWNCNIVKQI